MLAVGLFVLGRQNGCSFSFPGTGVKGSGPVQSETRFLEPFHAVKLQLSGDVEITRGDRSEVTVEAQGNLLPILKTDVENGVLKLFFDQNVSYSENVKIRVITPSLDNLDLMSSGTMKVLSPWDGDTFEMQVSGSGDIEAMQLNAASVVADINGSGSIKLAGKTGDIKADISGSGDLLAEGLASQTADLGVSGSGSMKVHVESSLKVKISGSGEVYYSGEPTVSSKVSGSGEVQKVSRPAM
jgi:hypothetical protein